MLSPLLALCEGNPSATGGMWLKKASNDQFWSLFCHYLDQADEQKLRLLVIWDPMTLKWCHYYIFDPLLETVVVSLYFWLNIWPWNKHSKFILTHWGRVTHICVSNQTIIGSDNGLVPGGCQSIIWTNAGRLLIRPLGTNVNEVLIEILTFSFVKMCLKVSSAKGCLFIPQSHRTATSLRSAKSARSPLIAAGSLWDLIELRGSAADRSKVSKVTEVAAKFWTCSKPAQWGRRGNRSP